MASGVQEDRQRRPPGGESRPREVDARSVTATRSLISAATIERRTRRREELEREVQRLHHQRQRLEREHDLSDPVPGHDVDSRLSEIERELRRLIADRRRLTSDPAEGRRGTENDLAELARLKSETDRLTAELLRCAYRLSGEPKKNPRLRRIWHMLRLSGS
jgi:DNA repair exonuclease SbcCD ATPase subunit